MLRFSLSSLSYAIKLVPDLLRYYGYRHEYDIPRTFRFNGPGIFLYGNGKLTIGENSYLGRYSSIQASSPYEVKIGKNCGISHFTMIYTYTREADQDMSQKPWALNGGDVIIKDDCWIGAHVFINPGVTIGENVVIGANSVVTHDIPDYAIAAGAPARVIHFKSCKRDGWLIQKASLDLGRSEVKSRHLPSH